MNSLSSKLEIKFSSHFFANAMLCLAATFVGAIAMVSAEPAQAQLQVCNRTNRNVSVATGYGVDGGWRSEGWYEVKSKQCEVVIDDSLTVGGYYYLYASDRSDDWVWKGSGNQDFCVHPNDKFTFVNKKETCGGKGTEWRSFFEVKADSSNETFNLTE
jgi:uncharacterized membrane protein